MGIVAGGCAYYFAAFGPDEDISPLIVLAVITGWFTRMAYRSWVRLSPAVVGELVMSLGVFMLLAPFPLLLHLANKYSDFLVITDAPWTGVIFPLSVYLVLLFLTIWVCKRLTGSLTKSLFSGAAVSFSDPVR